MTEYTRDSRGRGEPTSETEYDGESVGPLSRRSFLRTTAVAGASALAIGAGTSAASAAAIDETCESFGELSLEGGEFVVINNDWSAGVDEGVEMCSYVYDDGSYGWEWDRRNVANDSAYPNYPQVLLGTKPWGDTTSTSLFPIQRGDVDEMTVTFDVDNNPSGGEWNLALEWWLTGDRPGADVSSSITHEIMLVLEWSDDHNHGAPIDSNAFTDAYGNTVDYWANYAPHGNEAWSFHIFRVAANAVPDAVDLTAIVDYLDTHVTDSHEPLTSDLWISGIEIGNEYWPNTAGETRIHEFTATVNGQTASSGSSDSSGAPDPGVPDDPDDGDDSDDADEPDHGDDDSDDADEPDHGGDYPTWDAGEIYDDGDRVSWNGSVWEAQWWTQNQEPGTELWGPWEELGDADEESGGGDDGHDETDDSSDDHDDGDHDDGADDGDDGHDDGAGEEWDASAIYTAGDTVTWNGATWEAQWWTQNQEPGGSQWGPWEHV
ncbi:carbohydrate-binding protein [Natronobiforma cellulositropha]|uniref:carbohydrate-binding protein n=1 Tax=Natronobiforma cellulositropha TaxID=1679076 RepID=UPI00294FF3B8|nr:carbohydrate-binding protein [Natronobiforma cellulositropha]